MVDVFRDGVRVMNRLDLVGHVNDHMVAENVFRKIRFVSFCLFVFFLTTDFNESDDGFPFFALNSGFKRIIWRYRLND